MIDTLDWSLVHFVWQGFVGAGMLAVLLILRRKTSAQARSLTSCATLVVLACCPLVDCFWLPSSGIPDQKTAEFARETVGLEEGDHALQSAAEREAKNQGLRYTVEIQSNRDKPGELPALEPRMPEIELGGSLWMTAKLHNDGDRPLRVFWGDYAYPKMYRFDVTHDSGWKPAITRYWPDEHLPRAANEKYFVVIEPGEFASYDLALTASGGGNCERCYLNRPGRYVIAPSLFVATFQALDDQTGETRDVPDTWTGHLQARSFFIRVKGNLEILDEGVVVRGKVVDAAGQGVPQALVTVRHRVKNSEGPTSSTLGPFFEVELAQDVTDADGRFEFFRLPAESPSFELDVRHVEHQPRREVIFNNAPAGAKQRKYDAKVTLEAGRTVRGRVMDSQGKPLTDVRLTEQALRETYTDEQGRFTLAGLPPQVSGHFQVWRRGFLDRSLELPAGEDTNWEWTITLRRNSEQAISGKAAFIGGEPLRNMELAFAVEALEKSADSTRLYTGILSTKTDNQGRFKLVLPEPVEFNVKSVTAYAPGDRYSPRGIWRTKLDRIKPHQPWVKLIFDDTHKLVVEVLPVTALPEAFALAVRCVFVDERQTVREIGLEHNGGKVEFDKLSPGNYYVTVEIMPNRSFPTSSKKIEIAPRTDGKKLNDETPDSRLVFNFPDLHFGRLIGQVLTPDGEPAPKAEIGYHGRGAIGHSFLDANARFEIEYFPAGKVSFSAMLAGYDNGHAAAEVREGKTGTVQIVLKPLTEVWGAIAGRILYENGVPVLGATLDDFQPKPVPEDGSYKVNVRSDQPTFRFNLANADGWPRFDPNKRLTSPWESGFVADSLQVTMPVEPGKTTPRDIVLDRTRLGRLTLNWKRPAQQVQLFVSVIPFKDARRAKPPSKDAPPIKGDEALDEELEFTRSMSVNLEENGKLVIPDLPRGRRTVLLATRDLDAARIRTVPSDQADADLTFDANDDGRILFRLLDSAGTPKRESGFRLSAALTGRPKQIVAFWSSPDPNGIRESEEEPPKHPYLQADGSLQILHLDAGQYELVVHDGPRSKAIALEVKPRETTSIEVRIDQLKAGPPEQP